MPEVDLTGAQAGFFGKVPTSGDFVARGLPAGLRRPLDLWLTRTFAADAVWPEGGWRACLPWRGAALTILVLPSGDAAGRTFPLAVLCRTEGCPAPDAAEAWCDAALPRCAEAAGGSLSADALGAALSRLPPPAVFAGQASAPRLWRRGDVRQAVATDPLSGG